MKYRMFLLVPLLAWLQAPIFAQQMPVTSSRITSSQPEQSQSEYLAKEWGLHNEEWSRYKELMAGPLGIYSPNLDPLSALGIEARTDEERRRYAELQVQAEARRVEKLLIYQRAYDDAWKRLYPETLRVSLPDAMQGMPNSSNRRLAVFVRDDCTLCEQTVQRLQAAGAEFDVYMVGNDTSDTRIRTWARRARIDPVRVHSRAITLNHDSGRWQALGLSGDLPAVVRQVNGQWQRQP